MSDLIYLFGNNCDTSVISPQSNHIANTKCDSVNKTDRIKRPNTLRTRINTVAKHCKSPDQFCCNNKYNLSDRFPLTPANNHTRFFCDSPLNLHNSLSCSNLPRELPPENADGNIEYKRQLLNLTPLRLQHLITQLKWRLAEGDGEAIYEIGVDDDGKVTGLDDGEMTETLANLRKMAESLNASVSLLRECQIGSRKALEILIRKMPTHFSTHETRVAVLGNMDAGKSTLIGVLTQGVLDNGHGKTRLATFRHVHEVRSGRTSSISCQLLGFDESHNPFNFYWQKNRLHLRSHEEVVLSSSKLVTLIDLAGYHKYQRTTLFALTTRRPHLFLLVIPANNGFKGTSIDHCQLATTLGVPIAVVVTKIDRCSPNEAIDQLLLWLNARPTTTSISIISSVPDAKQAAGKISAGPGSAIPVFPVSCVTGKGIEILTAFLGTLQTTETFLQHQHAEIWIDQMYYEVPRVTGFVVSGLVCTGLINENDRLYLGPQKDGSFVNVTVESIHRNRVQQTAVESGQYASFAVCLSDDPSSENYSSKKYDQIKWVPQSPCSPVHENEFCVRRGMVLLGRQPILNHQCKYITEDPSGHGQVAWGIVVDNIRMLDDQEVCISDLQKQQGSWIVHCGNVYQKSEMLDLNTWSKNFDTSHIQMDIVIKDIIFNFKLFPQFIHKNYPVVFHRADQTIKIYGNIKMLLGSEAFRKRTSDKNNLNGSMNGFKHFSLISECKNWKKHKYSEDEFSDEYFTAPSSPVSSQ